MSVPQKLRVGVVGAGEVTQVVHLPTLKFLSDQYAVTAICDVSKQAADHVAAKWSIPHVYTSSAEMVRQDDIDLVLVANSDEYHASCAIEAAQAGKHVFIEKPMALTRTDAKAIQQAAQENQRKIYVGYMRRYAPAFQVFQKLLAESGPIRHAIVKDIIGPNSFFVSQSGTDPRKFGADIAEEAGKDKAARAKAILAEAIGADKAADPRLGFVYRLLGSLGSHDLSFMREALGGKPDKCASAFASHDGMFISASFEYTNRGANKGNDKYNVLYTTGIHNVGVFESFLEVWTDDRVLRIDIDTPYVKGLPINVTVKENDASGHYSERIIRPTYQDAYTTEFLDLHQALTTGKDLKTTPADAMEDLGIFDMIMAHLKA
ncbi:Oxidoreductase, N-terminal [Kalmanozyma brasiliensis GHG001]|uniref:NAD binding Rossmann fold oxidoreductase n=1 Tax=Kalmanozyma brasiliensis (strain GHG001) TaxID=1365824 RepID=V5E4K1_KALBG|nr:Oxidoreductase, N-terminal [Kalmanozyma brasiliensis GHG001]EST05101.1 Oxidoreductase, N-terminal [Kalmanozyma brasiliensis GHG001]